MNLNDKNVLDWLFYPMTDHTLENVVATTFTLAPSIVLELAARTECCRRGESSMHMTEQQMRIILAQECDNDKPLLTVFCDDQIIPSPGLQKRYNRVLNGKYLRENVCRIAMKDGCFFHPKLLIAHFRKSNEDHFRFAVLSKNLTHDTSMVEICALFESAQRSDLTVNGAEISGFFRRFIDDKEFVRETKNGVSLSRSDARKRIGNTLDALENAHLKLILPEDCPAPENVSLRFVAPGDKTAREQLTKDSQSCGSFYCCSDSISILFWEDAICRKNYDNRYLISNPRSWAKEVKKNSIPDYAYCVRKENGIDVGVHAKFAEFYGENKHILWLGSANFTENGFSGNYEADVRMEFEISEQIQIPRDEDSLLRPLPFSNSDIKNIKKVNAGDLEKVIAENDLKDAVGKAKWECKKIKEKDKDKLIFEGAYIPAFDELKQCLIVTGAKVVLEMKKDPDSKTISFYAETNYSDLLVPWYGKGTFIAFENSTKWVTVPVSISFVSDDGDQPEQPKFSSDDTARLLLKGGMDIINVIPPEPGSEPLLYRSGDTFDIRLAKYLAKGGKISDIRTEELSRIIEPYYDTDEDDVDDVQPVMTTKQAEKLKDRLKKLGEFLERSGGGQDEP